MGSDGLFRGLDVEGSFGLEVILVCCGGDWYGVKDVMGWRGCVGDWSFVCCRGGVVEALVQFGTVNVFRLEGTKLKLQNETTEKSMT